MTAVPLAVSTGPGFELRQPKGIAIVGGLLVAQLITLHSTPVMYLALDRLHVSFGSMFSSRNREVSRDPPVIAKCDGLSRAIR